MRGRARVVGAHEVEVDGSRFRAERIVVATGGWPVPPDVPGGERAISSNEIFDLARFPERLVVVGGGYIACEFASIFNGLGARVTQLYRGEQILRGFDLDIRNFVAAEMAKKGVDIARRREGARARGRGRRRQRASSSPTAARSTADTVLYATGRVPNTAGLGLDAVGVALDVNGAVVVDDRYRTSVPSIYAVGDVIDRVQLTPVALAEAMALVDDAVRRQPTAASTTCTSRPRSSRIPTSARSASRKTTRAAASRRSASTAPTSGRCATRCRGAASAR